MMRALPGIRAAGALIAAGVLRADTVALWLFDEPPGTPAGGIVRDTGPQQYEAVLGRGGQIVPGKFGSALRPVGAAIAPDAKGAASRVAAALAPKHAGCAVLIATGPGSAARGASVHPTDTRLNLGDADWTVEWWMRLDADAADEGVIFELGAGAPGERELLTRLSVLPREHAFVLAGLAPVAEAGTIVAKRVEFPNPEGPPAGEALLRSSALALDKPLPRGAWVHIALVHAAASRQLRLFVDGTSRAVAFSNLQALPRGEAAYLSIGRDGRWQRPFPANWMSCASAPGRITRRTLRRPRASARLQRDERFLPGGRLERSVGRGGGVSPHRSPGRGRAVHGCMATGTCE